MAIIIFYSSTLFSSIGSLVFQICLIGFMMKSNYSLYEISLVVGFTRISTVFCQFFWGDLGDKYSPRTILIITELICIILSYLVFHTWYLGPQFFWYFVVFASARASLVAIQGGPRGKLTKLYSTDSLDSNIRTATWLNKVTHGSFLVASFLSIYFLEVHSFREVIYFDMITFLIGGALLFLIEDKRASAPHFKKNLFKKFNYLFKYAKRPAIFDLFLAVSMTGLNMLTVRIVAGDSSKVPYFYAIYGLCVWLASFLKNDSFFKKYNYIYWLGMFMGFAFISQYIGSNILFIGVLFLYYCYWSIYHLITAAIQKNSPAEYTAGIVSARNILMLATIAIGELAAGSIFSKVPVSIELLVRAGFCFILFLVASRVRFINNEE